MAHFNTNRGQRMGHLLEDRSMRFVPTRPLLESLLAHQLENRIVLRKLTQLRVIYILQLTHQRSRVGQEGVFGLLE